MTKNYSNGDVYVGETNYRGEPHGKGEYRYHNGDVYRGDWVNCIRSGFGKYSRTDGSYYEGEWKTIKRTEK
ncbi:MAG: phosphatidylinositol-4-phosphate 5-kinase, partial [Candidatus Scatosoma sp.]